MTDWKTVIDDGFRMPEGLSQHDAVAELTGMLRDPDPVVRDEQVPPGRILDLAVERLREPTTYVFAEMEDCRLAHGIALTLTRARQEPGWLDVLQAELDADAAAHVLPHFANMIRVLQALYVCTSSPTAESGDRGTGAKCSCCPEPRRCRRRSVRSCGQ